MLTRPVAWEAAFAMAYSSASPELSAMIRWVELQDLIILHRLLDTQEFMNGMVQIIFKRELILLEKPMAIPQAQQLV